MKWTQDDLDVFHKEKDFIDTVLIPVLPIRWGNEMGRTVLEGRFTTILSEEAERHLTGRMILSPPFTYLKHRPFDETLRALKEWIKEMRTDGVKLIVCLASDPQWNQTTHECEEDGVLNVWLPALPLDHLDPKHKQDYLDDNVGQIMKKITNAWSALEIN